MIRYLTRLFMLAALLFALPAHADTIDQQIEKMVQPATNALSSFIFYSVKIAGADVKLIVVWLILGALFFTLYFRFINISGFGHAIALVSGKYSDPKHKGEISHFQALTAAISGTVGIGNIAGVAITVSIGGPGAIFWLMTAGFLGMATKFVECTLGVKYRKVDENGVVHGGPMYYLSEGLKNRGLGGLGKVLGIFYAVTIVIGCLGIGNMFQSNQAYMQILEVTGGTDSPVAGRGWLVGLVMAVLVALIIIGGIRWIAKVTARLVPFMVVAYVIGALSIILMNYAAIPGAVIAIVTGAFSTKAMAGGVLGVMILGFQRAAFSNEAGLGSAAIAHSAVKTKTPITEGYVALLEPFIDSVVICTLTGLVIVTSFPAETLSNVGFSGIELTSAAFQSKLSWSPLPLSVVAILFAFSTMLAWAYYGTRGWTFLFGKNKAMELGFSLIFCTFIVVGASVNLKAVLDFSDALIFVVAIPNILGLYLLAPEVKRDLNAYRAMLAARKSDT